MAKKHVEAAKAVVGSAAAVQAVCDQFIARSIVQAMKGKARDRAALEFMCGAASLAHTIGDKGLYSPLSFLALTVSIRGFSEVQRHATPVEKATQDEAARIMAEGRT